MLSWLSGAPPADHHDTESSIFQSQPETPAHIFAARAFKYRLWGTPKPDASQPRPRQRTQSMDRLRTRQSRSEEFLASPMKPNGILLTPGTTNMRRSKTVTFPAQIHDDGKPDSFRPISVTSRPVTARKGPSPPLELPPSTGKRSAFTERLQNARSTPVAAPSGLPLPAATTEDDFRKTTQTITTSDNTDWKTRYESYAARTEREMRKLITKQQAAKHYAKEADERATSLAAELAAERNKVAALESRVDSLTADLARLQAQLSRAAAPRESLEQRFSTLRSPVREEPYRGAAQSTPSRAPLEIKRGSYTPMQTPPRRGRSRITEPVAVVEDKENHGPSPRKTLDADRRAAAAARIAQRRRDKALAAAR